MLTKIADMGCPEAKSGQLSALDQSQLEKVFGFLLNKYDHSFTVDTAAASAAQQKKIVRYGALSLDCGCDCLRCRLLLVPVLSATHARRWVGTTMAFAAL